MRSTAVVCCSVSQCVTECFCLDCESTSNRVGFGHFQEQTWSKMQDAERGVMM